MIRAAGIAFITPDRRALFLKRGNGSTHPLEWCWPGGQLEDGETAEQAAVREVEEECGGCPEGARTLLMRVVAPADPQPPVNEVAVGPSATDPAPVRPSSGAGAGSPPAKGPGEGASVEAPASLPVEFTTFLQNVDAPWVPTLNYEHNGWAWAELANPPEPLHPGTRLACERLTADELGVARMMAAGRLPSPQAYANVMLWKIRITGTGVSYRQGRDEYVWREPSVYLNDEFLARCNGLPVIYEHPEKSLLNHDEFADRVVGTVLLPFIEGDEVWAIAKVYDQPTNVEMAKEQMSTSPAVDFRTPGSLTRLTLEDGSKLLVEGKPSLLDHIAICANGVWDKGGPPTGVDRSAVTAIADSALEELLEEGCELTADETVALQLALLTLDQKAALLVDKMRRAA